MKKVIFSVCAIALVAWGAFWWSQAHAGSIHSGSTKGAYHNEICPVVQNALKKDYFDYACETSDGTGSNINKVMSTASDIGIGQFNIVASNPDVESLAVETPPLGLECMYAVTSEPDITTLQGLSSRIPLALPPADSGSALTFVDLQSMDEGLSSLRNITHTESAHAAVQSVVDGTNAMAFFVQLPDTSNDVFKLANKNKLTFIPVINREILRQELNGERLYEPSEVVVTPQGLMAKFKKEDVPRIITTCTKLVLFTGVSGDMTGTAKQDQDDLIAVIGNITAPKTSKGNSFIETMLQNAKQMSDGALNDVAGLMN